MGKLCTPIDPKDLYFSKSEQRAMGRRFQEILQEVETDLIGWYRPGYQPKKKYSSD